MNWMVIVYVGCEILVAIGAIFGNCLVITAFRRERRLRRRTNYYIVSLAVADLLVGLLGIPCALLAYSGYPKQLHACLFTVSLLVVLCTISIFSLVAVSVDRYWAILYPMGYSRNVRTKTAVGIICFCWVAGAIVGFLPLLGWNAGQSGQELEECRFTKVMNYNFLVFIYFATIIFPGLLMAAFYAHIYSVVVKQLKQMVTVNGTTGGSGAMLRVLGAARKREVKATQNLSIIVLFFMVCWFPLYTINFIQAYHKDISIPTFLMDSCIILTHLNSAGNPLLYAYHLKDFRTALRAVLFGGTVEVDRRVIGRDNSAYLQDLEQRRRSSQLNLYAKSAKDQNLNLTHLPVINNKLSDIQETSRNDSSIKVIPSENNCEISKTTSFFKFPLDRSLTRLKDKEKTQKISNLSSVHSDKQDFTYNHLEESNASLANSMTKGEINEGYSEVVANGEVINNEYFEKDEKEKSENLNNSHNKSHSDCNSIKENNSTKKADGKGDCNNSKESNSKKSCTNSEGQKEKSEESCDDADYGDETDDDDEDTSVKTGHEITTGIFNDCFVGDDEDSVDEIDNSILSNDRVGSLINNDGQICISYRNLDDNNSEGIQEKEMYCDLKRNDSEIAQVGIPYNKLSSNDLEEVNNSYTSIYDCGKATAKCGSLEQNVNEEIDQIQVELRKNDSEKSSQQDIKYTKLESNVPEVSGHLNISHDRLNQDNLGNIDDDQKAYIDRLGGESLEESKNNIPIAIKSDSEKNERTSHVTFTSDLNTNREDSTAEVKIRPDNASVITKRDEALSCDKPNQMSSDKTITSTSDKTNSKVSNSTSRFNDKQT